VNSVGARSKARVKEYRGEVWQNGELQAAVECRDEQRCRADTEHYAAVYGTEGPVKVVYKTLRRKP
jgi:hypothetical protein